MSYYLGTTPGFILLYDKTNNMLYIISKDEKLQNVSGTLAFRLPFSEKTNVAKLDKYGVDITLSSDNDPSLLALTIDLVSPIPLAILGKSVPVIYLRQVMPYVN